MKKPIIISDFDGTISRQDVNDTIHMHFGDEKTVEIEEQFARGDIGCYDSLSFHYDRLKLSQSEFEEFVKNNIGIDSYFKDFYRHFIKENNLEIVIVSGGFVNYINILFAKNNIKFEEPIYANELKFKNNDIEVEFLHNIKKEECHQDFGVCGNCKYKIIKKYKKKKKPLIYIGDGLTDRCPAFEVDWILAKKNKSLEKYCEKNDLDYFSFTDFKEVKNILTKLIFEN
ncbi:MAG: MtnX-like HAD-IB family phosphatase [Bacillota bacterium]